MTKVDETPYIRECPRCGDDDKNNQLPVSAGGPCQHCQKPAWPLDLIFHYICQCCKTRYLRPRIELTAEEVAKLEARMDKLKEKIDRHERRTTGE